MADWNSTQYLKFENQRTQPARDLAMCINITPKTVVDIGCGPGNSTKVLKDFFPEAHIVGIDSSSNMVKKAKAEYADIDFYLSDAQALEGKYDLLFSNACLQWIPEHKQLIPSLMDKLNEGGVFAVQIPMNGEESLFQLIRQVVQQPEWGLAEVKVQPNETLTPTEYYDILSGCSSAFDMWEVKYYHTMANHQALVDWIKGTRIRPYLDFLGEERGRAFEEELVERSKELYPVMDNGNVVLGFRRFFFTAVK